MTEGEYVTCCKLSCVEFAVHCRPCGPCEMLCGAARLTSACVGVAYFHQPCVDLRAHEHVSLSAWAVSGACDSVRVCVCALCSVAHAIGAVATTRTSGRARGVWRRTLRI